MDDTAVKSLEFKKSWRQMVDAGPHAPKALADLTSVSYAQFQAYGDPSIDQTPPIHRLVLALSLCPDLSVSRYFASLQHAVVVPLPGAGDRSQLADVLRDVAALIDTDPHNVAALTDVATRLQASVAAHVLAAEAQATTGPQVVPSVRRRA